MPFHHIAGTWPVGMAVCEGLRPPRPGISVDGDNGCEYPISDTMWEVVQECWDSLPAARPSAEDVATRLKGAWWVGWGDFAL